MDDLFPLLLFLIFVLAPILEGLKRKNKPPPPPPPTQRRVPPRPAQRSRTEEVSTRAPADEDASTMVPDDLWEILTGQKRMPAPTAPPPAPAPRAEQKPSWDVGYEAELEEDEELERESVALEDVNVETRRARVEAQSLETIGRHPEPVIVSLEENIPTTAARHAAFHQRITTTPPEIIARPRTRQLFDLTDRSDLQRAFLLHEVLGKPKALEEF